MKKTIYAISALLFAVFAQAQEVDTEKINEFISDLKDLRGDHVECMNENFNHFATDESRVMSARLVLPPNIVTFGMRDQKIPLAGISRSDTAFCFVHAVSNDEIGYNLIKGVFDKYYDEDSEDIFGIPLMSCNREDGEEQTLFMDKNNTLLIRDEGEDVELIYVNINLVNCIQSTLRSVAEITDEDYIDVEVFGGIDFGVHVNDRNEFCNYPEGIPADPDRVIAFVQKVNAENIVYLESQVAKARGEEEREELEATLAEFKKEHEENLDDLRMKLNELERPEFVELIPGTDEYFVVIPKVAADLKARMKPYAASGVYNWINNTGFPEGARMGNMDQISCIVTPRDVAMQYVIRNRTRDKWFDDGFTAEYNEKAALEYQGGTPAVLYRFSQNEQGYNDMLRDLGYLFNREPGEKHWGLEVTRQSENNGKRFVQLWGEGGVLVCLFDSPQDKYCHFSVVIGGVDGFTEAVNEYIVGGEKDLAKKCNIIIDSDLSDNSYGIHFTTDDCFYYGKSHKNGVHIDFGYARKFSGL